ncbi:hypothetical protein ACP70R_012934 [Stipagrostis hirtigluma subsp. patula]
MTLQLGETVEGRWKDLPDDMCYLILDHLDHISVLSFSVTCKPWAKVCSSIPVFKSGMATLITSRPDVDGSRIEYDLHDGLFGLNVVSTQASVVCQSHALENRFWVGGKNDWVVLCDDLLNVELFNPITNTRVPLPSFSTIPDASIDPYFSSSLQYAPFSRLIERIALCQTPRHPDGYLAVAQFSEGFLAFTSASNFSWVALKNPTDVDGMVNYCPEHFLDAIVHMNNVLAVNMYGEIYSWDMRSPSVHPTRMMAPTQVPHPGFPFRGVYLAISPPGSVMVIFVHGSALYHRQGMRILPHVQCRFAHPDWVLIFEFEQGSNEWRRVSSLESSLFIGLNYPFYDCTGDLKNNHVYVSEIGDHDAAIFPVDMGEVELLDYPIKGGSLDVGASRRTPMWFRPTIRPVQDGAY